MNDTKKLPRVHTIKFTQVGDRPEWLFDYKKQRYLLQEKDQGVYGGGRAIMLYSMKGTDKTFLTVVGWTQSDHGYESYKKGNSHAGAKLITQFESRQYAIDYLNIILG